MISASNLGKSFGDHVLFEGASFQLNAGERYGLVGANGSGKTTLLGILSGDLEASEGTVSIPKSLRLGVLRQDQFLYEDEQMLGVAMMGNRELWHAMVEKEELLANAHESFDADRFGELEETVQRHDGYTAEARAATILEGLGLPTEVHRRPLSTLSGGFKLRVLLAQVLASAPDVLLLDEPTNHLDILSIRWLEKFLHEFRGPVVVISHDHRFLDNVASKILDVDYATVTLYHGNYSHFLEQKREERERREKEIESREKEIAHHQEFVDRFRAKNTKARQAQSKLRMIEKKAASLEALPGSSRRYPAFRFGQQRPSGRDVLTVKGVEKSFGDNAVLHGVDLLIRRGERVAIIGPNGIGKSTLLKIAMGELAADAGEAAWGYEAQPGYFAQDQHEQLEGEAVTAEEWLWKFCPDRDRGFVRGWMGMMLFSGEEGSKQVSALSGGEAARLVFSKLMLEKPNVLVLDEPTNHLDLESIEALVEGLRDFAGTLILVSHDRWFVGELATRVVEISTAGVRDYHGSYEEYVHALGDDHLDADAVLEKERSGKRKGAPAAGAAKPAGSGRGNGGRGSPPSKDPARARKALEERAAELAAAAEAAESRLAEIDRTFAAPGYYDRTPPAEVAALDRERTRLKEEAAGLFEDWERVESELGALR
ncbi:MAG TPA: ABC-F family ATP-binding cassette domain-containing protein [Longimicrobiales bacterium]|nr:ABC-F family ATP-binding cassette domain-containing protein [Longimicrobiales bacterium]